MKEKLFSKQLDEGIRLTVIPSEKFKTVTISYCFHRDLDENYTYQALIPAVLQRGCEGLEDYKKIQKHLEEQYGALFDVGVQKKGERQVLTFSADVVNEAYTSDSESTVAQMFHFFNRIINKPLLENGEFKKDFVELEKENLKNRILSLQNDKMQYSMERCIQEMCKDEKYSRYVFGRLEDLESLDSKKLYDIYRDMVESSPLDIFVVGTVEPEKILKFVEKSLVMKRKKIKTIPGTLIKKVGIKEKAIEEVMDISQGKLNIGLRTNVKYSDEDYFPLVLYNSILGGGPHSKLFINVREKASLAYYIFSLIDKFKGIMLIGAGIETEKYAQTLEIIREQLLHMKEGRIHKEEYQAAMNGIINSIKSAQDQPFQLMDHYLGNSIYNLSLSLDDFIERLKKVQIDDIVRVSQNIKVDTIYFLSDSRMEGKAHARNNRT